MEIPEHLEIRFYDTLQGKKVRFVPLEKGKVGIYACGVTVYDRCHLGHARGAINFDVLRRFLERVGYDVTFVKNFTDVDDKIIQKAVESNLSPERLGGRMIELHDEDMSALYVLPPHFAPKATGHVKEMVAMIETLFEKGFAYEAEGDVLFRAERFRRYGELSGKKTDELQAGARIAVSENKEKPSDFVLWKGAKPGEPCWESPWGKGRPGWHIECSAMAKRYLGDRFDLHLGGSDLIFPHHENEKAQSECANGKPFANYWLHNGLVAIDGEKMSKSLGNSALIGDLVQAYHPELLRFYVLQSHYASNLDFTPEGVEAAKESLDKIYASLWNSPPVWETGTSPEKPGETTAKLCLPFFRCLADDLNTPKALGCLFNYVKILNGMKPKHPEKNGYAQAVAVCASVLGLLNSDPQAWFRSPRIRRTPSSVLSPERISSLVEERENARRNKDFPLSDSIRRTLLDQGVGLKDSPHGTLWFYS